MNRLDLISVYQPRSTDDALLAAYLLTADGLPVDRLLADAKRTADFHLQCWDAGVRLVPSELSRRLLSLRKRGYVKGRRAISRTPGSATLCRRLAVHIALAVQTIRHEARIMPDHLLIDPTLRDEYCAIVDSMVATPPDVALRIALNERKAGRSLGIPDAWVASAAEEVREAPAVTGVGAGVLGISHNDATLFVGFTPDVQMDLACLGSSAWLAGLERLESSADLRGLRLGFKSVTGSMSALAGKAAAIARRLGSRYNYPFASWTHQFSEYKRKPRRPRGTSSVTQQLLWPEAG